VAALPRPGVGPVADKTIHPAGVSVTLAKRFRPSERARRTRARAGTRPWGIDNAAASFDDGVAAIRRLRSDESRYGDVIAARTGLSRSWIGLMLLATVTSLRTWPQGSVR
jgi:hypothetical protein